MLSLSFILIADIILDSCYRCGEVILVSADVVKCPFELVGAFSWVALR